LAIPRQAQPPEITTHSSTLILGEPKEEHTATLYYRTATLYYRTGQNRTLRQVQATKRRPLPRPQSLCWQQLGQEAPKRPGMQSGSTGLVQDTVPCPATCCEVCFVSASQPASHPSQATPSTCPRPWQQMAALQLSDCTTVHGHHRNVGTGWKRPGDPCIPVVC